MKINKKTIYANHVAHPRPWPGADVNVNKKKLVDFLVSLTSARHALGRQSKAILQAMDTQQWRVAAGIHAGGLGGGGMPPDPRNHITLTVGGVAYHLRFGGGKNKKIVEIT